MILISNAPIWTTIDSHMRAMGHVLIECLKIYKKKGVVVYKQFILQTNANSGETYRHKFQRNKREVHRGYTNMPNMDTWNAYEEQKDKFLEETYTELLEEATNKRDKKRKERDKTASRVAVKPLTEQELKVHSFIVQGMIQTNIAKELGVSDRRISTIVQNIRKKTKITKENKQMSVQKGDSDAIK